MKINETLKWATEHLTQSCERPTFEAELLLAYHLQKNRTYLHAFDESEVTEVKAYKVLVERRANHEPYEYIVGEASFYDIELEVESGVLIPRPETEIPTCRQMQFKARIIFDSQFQKMQIFRNVFDD